MLWRGDDSSPPTPALVDAEILAALERHASRTAIVDAHSGRALTFAQLGDGARRLAAGLATRGVGHRDVVAIAAGNGPDYAVALLGGLAAGAAVASANPALTAQELKHHFGLSEPRLVFADHRSLTAVAEAGAPAIAPLDALGGLLAPPRPGPSGRTPDDPALLFPSSGTTGLPKLAVHTHAGTTAFLQAFVNEPTGALAGDDVVGILVPFPHLFGSGILLHALRSGARAVTLPVADFEGLLRMVAEHGVTVAPVTPPVIAGLARSPLVDRYDLSSLRRVICSAAPCSPALQEQAAARLDCAVGDYLGITEAWCVAAAADPVVRGSVGRLVANLEAIVVDPDSGARLGPGEPGELRVRGPQVMTGYIGAGASPLDADGWLATGDLCRLDAAGNVFIVDRLKELIKVGGYSVAPAEVERELAAHPAVEDVAVVAAPDPGLGQVPVAFVALRAPAAPHELRVWLGERLAPWKQVREVTVIERVPRTPAGKLLRRQLATSRPSSERRATPSLANAVDR